jgi:tRNA A-37 threonylcarbamoyl transferase component Bud32
MTFDDEFESRIRRFEQARRLQVRSGIAKFLDPVGEVPAVDRTRLLVELICIDLEFEWRVPREQPPSTLEIYIAQFPELNSLDRLPIELIGEEYRVRHRWGDRPSHASMLARFRHRLDLIEAEMLKIDAELAAESPPPVPRLNNASRIAFEAGNASPVPLLSPDDFLIRRLIGAGRVGKVYEAISKREDRPVAVKFLRKSFLNHPEVVQRFLEEFRTIARLRHPNIVGTAGLGRTLGGSYFIVMDLVNGLDLARVVARRAIAVNEALRWISTVCEAIEHAHEMGIVHCDLKPANLLLDDNGQIRVTDFGLARSNSEETPWASEIEGTAPFMAPEQASESWGPIDARTDVYGIGAVLFTLLTGRPPFLGQRLPDILAQVITATPVISPAAIRPELPSSVVDLCEKCLAKAKAERFSSVREIREAIDAAI